MNIPVQKINGILIAYLQGELNSETSGYAYDHLIRIAKCGEKRIIFHLGELHAVSRAGARGVLVSAKLVQAAGGEVRICGGASEIRQRFSRMGFSHLYLAHGDLWSALSTPWSVGDSTKALGLTA